MNNQKYNNMDLHLNIRDNDKQNNDDKDFPDKESLMQHRRSFPIIKPQLYLTNPQFPYKDNRHYEEPSSDFPRSHKVGYIAERALSTPHSSTPKTPLTPNHEHPLQSFFTQQSPSPSPR